MVYTLTVRKIENFPDSIERDNVVPDNYVSTNLGKFVSTKLKKEKFQIDWSVATISTITNTIRTNSQLRHPL